MGNGGLAAPSLHRGHPLGWARTTNLRTSALASLAGTDLGTQPALSSSPSEKNPFRLSGKTTPGEGEGGGALVNLA
eukprot:scaffold236730_cov18-Tisochrysis_lutea.AAC.1